ncbi:hypothetical protein B0T18DRAFT_420755 [Schizothecium vesticola]|uniref:Secreted protein n=1 Tax=Schizothecium vesticola TaxID=314040 RepID=A0AA40BP89_9PEZI|nr:hypothetical protein B0T18DRAFT_420755 [Schizothecium vesticola]
MTHVFALFAILFSFSTWLSHAANIHICSATSPSEKRSHRKRKPSGRDRSRCAHVSHVSLGVGVIRPQALI